MSKTVTIQYGDGEQRVVECYLHGKFAVHLTNFEPLKEANPYSCWTVTHVATGLSLTTICDRPAARRLARALDQAIEVDITSADIKAKTPTWRAFRPIAKELVDAALVV